MPFIISCNQNAFIEGRIIIDNILLAQEVVNDYGQTKGRPRCALKIDIRKAFDSVCWSSVMSVMEAMGFPTRFLGWIINECITTPMYSIKVKGQLEGFF